MATAKRVTGPCDSVAATEYPEDAKSVHDSKPDFQRLLQEVSASATTEESRTIIGAADLSAVTESETRSAAGRCSGQVVVEKEKPNV